MTSGSLDQQGRPAGTQHGVRERRHLQARRDRVAHPAQLAEGFELGHEIT
jgi:hypothetical protein